MTIDLDLKFDFFFIIIYEIKLSSTNIFSVFYYSLEDQFCVGCGLWVCMMCIGIGILSARLYVRYNIQTKTFNDDLRW